MAPDPSHSDLPSPDVLFPGPFTAHRHLNLVGAVRDDRVTAVAFSALTSVSIFGAKATAVCIYGGDHKAPGETCACGFYALSDRDRIRSGQYSGFRHNPETALATVEFSGDVIEGSKGFRAECQRVRDVEVWGVCQVRRNCRRRTEMFITDNLVLAQVMDQQWRPLVASCARHAAGVPAVSLPEAELLADVTFSPGRPVLRAQSSPPLSHGSPKDLALIMEELESSSRHAALLVAAALALAIYLLHALS